MRKLNKARGEVALEINGHHLIICAQIDCLEQVEQARADRTFGQMMNDMNMLSISTLKECLFALTIEGDGEGAWASQVGALSLVKIQQAITAALFPDLPGGKDEAEVESP
ncbi:hypothetical protein [Pseudovibrio sp. Tun.PSC04-5.I4]|uniref:hypothetical protein n=1 Tax=Pseudovibrio sp. Tun.PSC04-5.I4 TaxID=1798213 RepID=UPI00088141E5|nr:hypothetical protein [Pseudovibrio sp. Tun.PSC04-5.I4]SDR19873.1 hypothetical protein SAMN04515695_3347 [Pseudovibrio sp. Tun.PSC04-5.I4]